MQTAQILVFILKFYTIIGTLVAIVFLFIGLDRVEPSARGAYAFRPLIIPGLILLWPLVWWRWWQIENGRGIDTQLTRAHSDIHARIWKVLAVVLPCLLLLTLAMRQSGPLERPAVPLDSRAMTLEIAR